jgi:hypothetical protein
MITVTLSPGSSLAPNGILEDGKNPNASSITTIE